MAISPWLYGIDGQFGSWKTSSSVKLIRDVMIGKNVFIFTNIKLNFSAPNIYRYKEVYYTSGTDKKGLPIKVKNYWLLDVFRFCGELKKFCDDNKVARKDRPRIFIFDDEAGITFNQNDRSKLPLEFVDYLLQVRKLNVTCFLIAQKYKNIAIQLREHIFEVFYTKKLFFLDFFGFIELRRKEVELDWKTVVDAFYEKDENWNKHIVEYPRDSSVEVLRPRGTRRHYDDRRLNKAFDSYPISSLGTDLVWFFETIKKVLQFSILSLWQSQDVTSNDFKHHQICDFDLTNSQKADNVDCLDNQGTSGDRLGRIRGLLLGSHKASV